MAASINNTPNPHLTDPSLAPFLAESFSVSSYLNSTLPPLLPPSALSSSSSSSSSRPAGAVPLSALSTQTTTLLSTLDYQAQRLLTTLTTLTDEILRLAPRLAYSVDLLRSDVVSLGEELQGQAAVAGVTEKPPGLERLKMLATVRERVEEVVRVFGEAMDWGGIGEEEVAAAAAAAAEDDAGTAKKSGKDPAGEIVYLLASGDLEGAQKKSEALRLLASVFEGTVEGPARAAVVDKLEEKVKAALEKAGKKEGKPVVPEKKVAEEKKEEGGYYGLIEQLKGLRGMT